MLTQQNANSRRCILWVLAASILVAFAFQGTRGLWEPDEGRYTNVALEMMSSGNYLVPYRHPETKHVTKPPVTYWTIAASAAAFGKSEWAFRLPMALAFIFSTFLVSQLGKTFTPKRPWLPALIYLSSPITMLAANAITTDTLLACTEAAAVLAYVNHRFAGKSAYWLDAMWALFGLAFMIKGPPGLLPLIAIVVWEWRKASIRNIFRPLGLLSFIAIGLSWFVWITLRYPELLNYFFGHELVDRVASATHDRNSQWYGGFLVYMPTLLLGYLPWLVFLCWRHRKKPVESELIANSRFLWLWLLCPLIIFMFSRSRLPFYALPLFTPLALLLAQSFENMTFKRFHILFAIVLIAILISIKAYIAYMPNSQDARKFSRELRPLLPKAPEELVFIDTKARYGLRFYLGASIEKISLENITGNKRISDAEFDDDLRHELSETEVARYFIVPSNRSGDFVSLIKSCNLSVELLGRVENLEVFDVEKIKIK